MKRFRALIVDDEPLARRTIWRLLGRHQDFEVIGDAADGISALEAIRAQDPDVIFLDIRMPRLQGLELARQVQGDRAPLIVVVTAFEQHAVESFRVHVADYLLKPFDDAQFDDCIAHLRQRLETDDLAERHRRAASIRSDTTDNGPPGRERLAVPVADGTRFIEFDRIDWIEARGYRSVVHSDGAQFPLRESLTRLEGRLDPRRFVRVHRSAIVRVDIVREIHPLTHGDCAIVLDDGTRLRMSRSRRAEVLPLLGLNPDESAP